jgi:hypothetical protein
MFQLDHPFLDKRRDMFLEQPKERIRNLRAKQHVAMCTPDEAIRQVGHRGCVRLGGSALKYAS